MSEAAPPPATLASTANPPASPSRDRSKSLTPPPTEEPLPSLPRANPAPSGPASAPMIDPELASLPAPTHTRFDANGRPVADDARGAPGARAGLSITESIARAPQPRTADFSMDALEEKPIDLEALEQAAEEGAPGSPTGRMMRAVAPTEAKQPDSKWPIPPPNASVNLYIGRALLSNGNDNWPLKPNEIVNWIRKHYPSEWDGDEGRCSAHRVRTYLARKGTDMYYEKLNQGCIAGWRIRANHLWRFENGGFQGRGMKQEEAIAEKQKETEALMTAGLKAAAAEALAAGHPGVKTSMSQPGTSDGTPPVKRPKYIVKNGNGTPGLLARQKPRPLEEEGSASYQYPTYSSQHLGGTPSYAHLQSDQHHSSHNLHGASSGTAQSGSSGLHQIDPALVSQAHGAGHGLLGDSDLEMRMVQQAMAAAAAAGGNGSGPGGMDELDMGMQIPIEMQMHGGGEDGDDRDLPYGVEMPQGTDQYGQAQQAYGAPYAGYGTYQHQDQ